MNIQGTVRESIEKAELNIYTHKRATTILDKSTGLRNPDVAIREKYDEPCMYRTDFQRDRDRIIHSKSFRRLMHKTQVFLAPNGDHYRTRLTHTLEVAQIARSIARGIGANEDLVEAIALGHDLGHTPFGHAGERALNGCLKAYDMHFVHSDQSVRVVEVIEKNGEGLNLTREVRDGIKTHQTGSVPATLEGEIVQISDKIAYVNHDIDDALRAEILNQEDILKQDFVAVLGETTRDRINTLITAGVNASIDADHFTLPNMEKDALFSLKQYLTNNVYMQDIAKIQETKAVKLIELYFKLYMENFDFMPEEYKSFYDRAMSNVADYEIEKERQKALVVCDYIAGMTDNYAIDHLNDLFVPSSWKGQGQTFDEIKRLKDLNI